MSVSGDVLVIVEVQVVVDAPVSVVLDRLIARLAAGGFDDAVTSDFVDTHVTLLRAGVAGITTRVAVQALPPLARDDGYVIPIRWEAAGPAGELFPALDADVVLTGDGNAESAIRLVGSYVPPFGRAGAAVDRLVMHRVAVVTLRRFLGHLADEATEPLPREVRPPAPGTIEPGPGPGTWQAGRHDQAFVGRTRA
jgi:hypothetical protein